MIAIVDDIESRPGSAVSLTRTFVGLYLRRLEGWVAVADLVVLLKEAGLRDADARNAISKLKQKRLLLSAKRDRPGYALNPAALPMLERGDARIFALRQMQAGDPWMLVSFAVAEKDRHLRHQLRKRLQWLGLARVAAGLWLGPEHLAAEVAQQFEVLGVAAEIFVGAAPYDFAQMRNNAARWWPLAEIAVQHDEFLTFAWGSLHEAQAKNLSPQRAFALYMSVVDRWRPLPYIDPGLPERLLPDGWPAKESQATFARLHRQLAPVAWQHVRAQAG